MIRQTADAFRVRVPNRGDVPGKTRRGESMIDAEPIAAMTVPGILPSIWESISPDIAKARGLNLVEEQGCGVGRAGFIDIRPAGIEITKSKRGPCGMRA